MIERALFPQRSGADVELNTAIAISRGVCEVNAESRAAFDNDRLHARARERLYLKLVYIPAFGRIGAKYDQLDFDFVIRVEQPVHHASDISRLSARVGADGARPELCARL